MTQPTWTVGQRVLLTRGNHESIETIVRVTASGIVVLATCRFRSDGSERAGRYQWHPAWIAPLKPEDEARIRLRAIRVRVAEMVRTQAPGLTHEQCVAILAALGGATP